MAQAMLAIEDSEAKNKQDLHLETMKNVLYSSSGTIEVKAQKSNGIIQVLVIDNGIEISKEDQEKLFRIDIKTKSIGKSNKKGPNLA